MFWYWFVFSVCNAYSLCKKANSNYNASPDAKVTIEAGRKLVVTYKADGKVIDTVKVDYGEDATTPKPNYTVEPLILD